MATADGVMGATSAALCGLGASETIGMLVIGYALAIGGPLFRANRLTLSALDDLPALLSRAVATTGLLLSAVLVGVEAPVRAVAGASLLWAMGALLIRTASYTAIRAHRRRRIGANPTIVLGAGEVGNRIANALIDHPDLGLTPIGFLDEPPVDAGAALAVPLLGRAADLHRCMAEHQVTHVIVAFSAVRESAVVDALRECDAADCRIYVVPRLYELRYARRCLDQVWGLPLVEVSAAPPRTHRWRLKRVIDVLLAVVAAVLLAPVMALLALAVHLEHRSSVLFRQERVGLGSRRFELLKFRTLVPFDGHESQTLWSIADDQRVGPVGRFMRRTSLDELPQLWNVLRGDMSIVGPRPERPYFVEQFCQQHRRYGDRHRVPPGMTGWAQVHGLRGDTSISERACFDDVYINDWSLWGDMKIMLRTVPAVLRRSGG